MIHDFPTVFAGLRPNVDQPIGGINGVFIVLDHDQCVADIPQMLKGSDESLIVTLMQTNRRLIQHIQHPCQTRPDLCCQANTLGLTTGQRARSTIQGKIVQPDVKKEF